jgi:hypothetical protein
MAAGDHVFVRLPKFEHHGIDTGHSIIHYGGDGWVRETSYEGFTGERAMQTKEYGSYDDADVVLERIESMIGRHEPFNLLFNNCEGFAYWAKTGRKFSEQAHGAISGAGGTAAVAASVGVGVGAVIGGGVLAGTSGASLMSGLAAIGAAVGAGAAAGIAVVGGAPAALTAATVGVVLHDDEHFTQEERAARHAGRVASAASAIGATGGAVGAVAACGTVGLSAAGITSGLAAIGAIVGGGMMAGIVVCTVAPAVVAGVAGVGCYRLLKCGSADS